MNVRSPINMGHNMHVKLFQMLSLKIANRVTLFIKNLGPRTNQLVRYVGLHKFIASANKTVSFNITITKVMLSSHHISKHSRTERTLVGDNQSVDMVSELMPWQFGFDFVMGKLAETVTFVATSNTR